MEKVLERTSSTQVIIAALNEEKGIGPTITDLQKYLRSPRILVADGRSSDRTAEIARSLGAEVFCQDGFGKGDAVAKAIKRIDVETEYVVITDADFTYPAEYIPEMIRILNEKPEVGMVCGNRFTPQLDKSALHDTFYLGNRLLAFTHNFLNGVQLDDPLTGLRVVRAEILRGWIVKSKGFDVEVELNHLVERKDFGIEEIPINYRSRLGVKKLKARHGASILKRIMLETTA